MPFLSFPQWKNAHGPVVERAFTLHGGYLLFRVLAREDAELKPVIWECLKSLQTG
jgi:hypothetical protein